MYLLFDIGGTKTRIAVSKEGVGFGEPIIFETPETFEEGVTKLIQTGKDILAGERAEVVAGGIAGNLNSKKTKLANSTNLKGWIQKPLYKELFMAFGTDVFIENDAALVGLGETHYGAGQGHDIVAYITLSTGIGGTRIVNGKIDSNVQGFEPGHQYIEGTKKNFEELVSGNAILLGKGVAPENIKDKSFWDAITQQVAVGLNNVAVFWSPNIIVLGGGLVRDTAINISDVKNNLEKVLTVFPEKPKIIECVLGGTGGLYGALVYAKQKNSNKS